MENYQTDMEDVVTAKAAKMEDEGWKKYLDGM